MKKPEKECPNCKGELEWKVVRDGSGTPVYNGLCRKCSLVLRRREAPQITEGKKLERNGMIDGVPVKKIGALDRRIMRLPNDIQLGILRERQKTFKIFRQSR